MGSSVDAACECGYSASSFIGGGMMTFKSECSFPALCRDCEDMVEVNLFAEPVKCPKCKGRRVVAYDSPELRGEAGTVVVASWNVVDKLGRALTLDDGTYKCPACGEFKLRFAEGGICFD